MTVIVRRPMRVVRGARGAGSASAPGVHDDADGGGGHAGHEHGVPDVALHEERPDHHGDGDRPAFTVGHGPHQEGEQGDGGQRDVRVPRVAQHLGSEAAAQQRQRRPGEQDEGQPTPSPGQAHGAGEGQGVEQRGAEEQVDRLAAEEVVRTGERPVEHRAGVVPSVAGVGADERGVAAHVADPQGQHRPVTARAPDPVEGGEADEQDGHGHRGDDDCGQGQRRPPRAEAAGERRIVGPAAVGRGRGVVEKSHNAGPPALGGICRWAKDYRRGRWYCWTRGSVGGPVPFRGVGRRPRTVHLASAEARLSSARLDASSGLVDRRGARRACGRCCGEGQAGRAGDPLVSGGR